MPSDTRTRRELIEMIRSAPSLGSLDEARRGRFLHLLRQTPLMSWKEREMSRFWLLRELGRVRFRVENLREHVSLSLWTEGSAMPLIDAARGFIRNERQVIVRPSEIVKAVDDLLESFDEGGRPEGGGS